MVLDSRDGGDRRRWWWRGLAVLVLLGVWAVLLGVFATLGRRAAQAEGDHWWAQLVEVAARVQAVAMDEVNVVVHAGLEGVEVTVDPTAVALSRERRIVVEEALVRLEVLATEPGGASAPVEALRDLYEGLEVAGDAPIDPDEARFVAEEQLVVLEAAAPDAQAAALVELVAQAAIPRLVVADLLEASYLREGAVPAAPLEVYFEGTASYLSEGYGGWLEPGDGTVVSPYVESGRLQAHLPAAWDELRAAADIQDAEVLVRSDGWVAGWPDNAEVAPPVTHDEVALAASTVAAGMDHVVAGTLDGLQVEHRARADSAAWQRWGVLAVLLTVVVLAGTVSVVAARRHWGRVSRWREAALVDPLTGLPNRRALREISPSDASSATSSEDDGHALLLFDLDHFKRINDSHGHAAGDQALRTVAVRATDVATTAPGPAVAARLGGDEFVVLARGLADPGAQAGALAEELIRSVRSMPLVAGGARVELSISVGVATAVGPVDLDRLLDHADEALYEVKRNGRGRHHVHPGTAVVRT